jgi:hypothetical protein
MNLFMAQLLNGFDFILAAMGGVRLPVHKASGSRAAEAGSRLPHWDYD